MKLMLILLLITPNYNTRYMIVTVVCREWSVSTNIVINCQHMAFRFT